MRGLSPPSSVLKLQISGRLRWRPPREPRNALAEPTIRFGLPPFQLPPRFACRRARALIYA
jgi:hypothetical protein